MKVMHSLCKYAFMYIKKINWFYKDYDYYCCWSLCEFLFVYVTVKLLIKDTTEYNSRI